MTYVLSRTDLTAGGTITPRIIKNEAQYRDRIIAWYKTCEK